jgi:hypothetical protein
MPPLVRRDRGRRALALICGIVVAQSCALGIAAALLDDARGILRFFALISGSAAGLVAYRGWLALDELDGTRIVPRAESIVYQALQLGLIAAGFMLGVLAHLLASRTLVLPWSFLEGALGLGSALAIGALFGLGPGLAARIGIGPPTVDDRA